MSTLEENIGVRELRQNASRYLDLVEAGWTVHITRHGRLVARLVPVRDPDDELAALIADSLVTEPEQHDDLLAVLPAAAGARSPSEELTRLRGEERW